MPEGRILTDKEKREYLNAKGARHRDVHSFSKKICHWPYCSRCGLVALKNDASRRAMKEACEWED